MPNNRQLNKYVTAMVRGHRRLEDRAEAAFDAELAYLWIRRWLGWPVTWERFPDDLDLDEE